MAITDLLVMPPDVVLTPAPEIPSPLRARLRALDTEFALGRSRVRASSKLVSADGAELLTHFRTPTRVTDAVLAYCADRQLDPRAILAESFPLLRDCYAAGYLAPADSPAALRIEPLLDRGAQVGRVTILSAVAVREDSELYQVRLPDGSLGALKMARPGAGARLARTLAHEAGVLQQLDGRGSPSLLQRGRHEARPYLLMTWSGGVPVGARAADLRARGLAGRRHLQRLVGAVAHAYARLHSRGVLHGDVQPDNIIIARRDRVTILDFGAGTAGSRRPPARGVVLPYAEPELARAMHAERRAPASSPKGEQAAVAALCYALCTGVPHVDMSLDRQDALARLAAGGARPFADVGLEPWPALEAVLARALAANPDHRFPSLRAFASAITSAPVPRPSSGRRAATRGLIARISTLLAVDPRESVGAIPAPRCSIMLGAGGTVYGLYRLACLRDDAELLATAQAWLAVVRSEAAAAGAFEHGARGVTREVIGHVSPYYTATGLPVLGGLLAGAAGDPGALVACVSEFTAMRLPADAGLDLAMGLAGALLGTVLLAEALPAGMLAPAAALGAFGDTVSAQLTAALAGVCRFPDAGPLDNAGMAHGWGGVCYALLRWCRWRQQAPGTELGESVSQLAAAAHPSGRGVRFPHRADGSAHHEIPGWCNGPAGLVHLFTLAGRMMRVDRYVGLAEECGWSAVDAAQRSPDLCCGIAGRCQALLQLYQVTGDRAWVTRAQRLRGKASRMFPPTPDGRFSLYKGALGLLLLDADLAHPEQACHPFFGDEGWPHTGMGANA